MEGTASSVIRRIFLKEEAEEIFSLQAKAPVFQRHYPQHADWLKMAISEIVQGKRFAFGAYVSEVKDNHPQLRLVGSIILKSESYSRVMQLKNLYIADDERYRKKGLGTDLFAAVERFCIKRGSSAIETEVPVQERATVAFLNRVGFLVHTHLESPYRRGDLLYRMYRQLPRVYTRDPFDLLELTKWTLDVGMAFDITGVAADRVEFSRRVAVEDGDEARPHDVRIEGIVRVNDAHGPMDRTTAEVLIKEETKRGRALIVLASRRFSPEAQELAAKRRVVCLSRGQLDAALKHHYPSAAPTFDKEDIGGIIVQVKSAFFERLGTQGDEEKTYFKGGPIGQYLKPGATIYFYVESDSAPTGAIRARATVRQAAVGEPLAIWENWATRGAVFESKDNYEAWASDKVDVVAIGYENLVEIQPITRDQLKAAKGLPNVEDDRVGTFYLSADQVQVVKKLCKTMPQRPAETVVEAPLAHKHSRLQERLTKGEFPNFRSEMPEAPKVREVRETERDALLKASKVLLVTVAEVELRTALSKLRPVTGGKKLIATGTKGQMSYWFGRLGDVPVVVTRCSAGTKGRDAAAFAVLQAIEDSRPVAVIGVGIAFGGYTDKLNMCDVLVSKTVIPYEIRREGAVSEFRGSYPEAGPTLLGRFTNAVGWNFQRPDGYKCKVVPGPLLTGELLLDSATAKLSLFAPHETAIGGDMEAFGIYAASSRSGHNEWIVVKAVSDWGDGTKQLYGDAYQATAAAAAMSLVEYVLAAPTALDGLE